MSRKWFKLIISLVMVLSFFGIQSSVVTNAAEGDFNLTIMHTNDTHANLDNVAKTVTLVKQIRAENPNNLLLDAGDVFSGTLYFNEFLGQADLAFMNLMQYDAMTFGNHEFDLGDGKDGHAGLRDFIIGADFPLVATNVDFSADPIFDGLQKKVYEENFNNGEIYNGIIKEIDGEKVGIFGLTTEETGDISSPDKITFSNYITAANEAVAAFESQGVNKIIALTHIGFNDSSDYDNDQLLAAAVEGIDVIVGGHTHVKLDKPFVYDGHDAPVLIVQANEYNKFLGQLDVTFDDNGVITSHDGKLHDVGAAEADAEAADLLVPYAEQIEELKNESTGVDAKVPLNGGRNEGGVRASETNLGNLITDGMLSKAKSIDPSTVIAMQNGGGIRASIDAGDITLGEVLTVMPFGNALAIMNLTGAEIISTLEHSVKEYPRESGGFLHVAGLSFNFDPEAAVGSKILAAYVTVDGKKVEIDPAAHYKVATNTFTAKGGDGYAALGKAYEDGRVSEPGFVDWEMFVEHIQELGEVNPKMEGRINPVTPGWKNVERKRYYVDDKGNLAISWTKVNENWYYFNEDGVMQTSWLKDGGKWYYLDKEGVMQTQWQKVGPNWHYFTGSGVMKTGWLKDGSKWYYLDKSGNMQTEWTKVSGKWYFLNENGAMRTGWLKDGAKWYLLDTSGAMQTDWVKVNAKWYFLDSNGAMKTNWLNLSGKWYLLATDGSMETGWKLVNNKWYYLYESGQMAANTTINGYKVDENGAWIQ